jgi:Tfp pilus assembly protein PilN
MLLAAPPLLKNYNMLPASYRRRDNLKSAIFVLLFLNLVGLAALGGLTLVKQTKQINLAEQEISRLQPLVSKVKETKEQIGQTEQFLDSVAKMKGNPDLFAFLANLTLALPAGSYLNQLQFTAATNSVTINGFTDNVGDLTEKLQAVGESRLQSTSRRQNMTYFQVEISLP